MSSAWNPRKKTVELQPSRIRRDPVRADSPAGAEPRGYWRSSEWEVRLAILGIVLFALAIEALSLGIGVITG